MKTKEISVPGMAPHRAASASRARNGASLTICMLLLSGCTVSPSIGVLGAYFPDWLFCIVGALVMTALINRICIKSGWDQFSGRPIAVIVYPAIAVILALGCWLAFFQN